MEIVRRLQAWYAAQCDGDWENEYGVRLESLDNPGWRLTVDLEGTQLQGLVFPGRRNERSDQDWIRCEVKDGRFEGRCGPLNLQELLEAFLEWVASVDAAQGP